MSKFLNISTDTTLGGNSPSDEIVSSQKALKTYIDANAGGASDGTTINKNSSNQLQAIGLINKNTANGATNPKYDWVGTLQEYEDQNVATSHPEWICYITDDVQGGTSVYTKSQVNNLLSAKANSADVYTKSEIDTSLALKADKASFEVVNALPANPTEGVFYFVVEQ